LRLLRNGLFRRRFFRNRFPGRVFMGRQQRRFFCGRFWLRFGRFWLGLGFWFGRFRLGLRLRFGRFRLRLRCPGSPLGHKFQDYRGTPTAGQFQCRCRAGGKVHNTAFRCRYPARYLYVDLLAVAGVGNPYLGSQGQTWMACGKLVRRDVV
jgi:hypothetical protein